MARYFQSLAQAEKHIGEQKSHPVYSKLQWCIIDCRIGYLVLSAAQAHQCFPALFHRSQPSWTPSTKNSEQEGNALV